MRPNLSLNHEIALGGCRHALAIAHREPTALSQDETVRCMSTACCIQRTDLAVVRSLHEGQPGLGT